MTEEKWNIEWEGIEYFIGVLEGSDRAVCGEAIFEEIIAENFTELVKDASDFKELAESQVK